MTMNLYNHLSTSVEPFTSIEEGKVRLYTCGPTVYNFLTVGNWAAYIYWDVLVRTLTAHGYDVTRVMNITDVGHLVSDADEGEDKLEKGARREGKTAWEVAQFYTDDFLAGMKALHLLAPTHLPKATEYIEEQLELVRTLKAEGVTYQISDGIYFDTAKFPRYNDFAHLHLDAQKAGARVEFNPEKRQGSDFALWKFTPEGENRDMQWQTPADLTDDNSTPQGFPGWHLECSAMAMSLLGETLDIHTGGIDHIPVHHTNEIAQSEAATDQQLSRFWTHNNHLKVDGTKISKSLGNGHTLEDLKTRGFEPLDLKLLILQGHYQSEGNFTFTSLEAAQHRRHHWRNVAALRHQLHDTLKQPETSADAVHGYAAARALVETLGNNLDTPGAFLLIDEAFAEIEKRSLSQINRHALVTLLETIDETLGLELLSTTPDISDDTKMLVIERTRARDAKDYKKSDELRDELAKKEITVRDTAHGPIWEYLK